MFTPGVLHRGPRKLPGTLWMLSAAEKVFVSVSNLDSTLNGIRNRTLSQMKLANMPPASLRVSTELYLLAFSLSHQMLGLNFQIDGCVCCLESHRSVDTWILINPGQRPKTLKNFGRE